MNRLPLSFLMVFLASITVLTATTATSQSQQQIPATQQQVGQINDRFHQQFLNQITGHEKEPAQKVFKNIQIPFLKNTPAQVFLNIMDFGYSKALGVACTHCHVETDFASDDKRPKRAAREMAALHRAINEQLAKMENLLPAPNGRFINCSTCHRGAVNPIATSD